MRIPEAGVCCTATVNRYFRACSLLPVIAHYEFLNIYFVFDLISPCLTKVAADLMEIQNHTSSFNPEWKHSCRSQLGLEIGTVTSDIQRQMRLSKADHATMS